MSTIQKIYAAEAKVGDTLLIDGTVATVVSQITTYFLASAGPANKDKVVGTSSASGRWEVLHFSAAPVNAIRFPHELVTVLR